MNDLRSVLSCVFSQKPPYNYTITIFISCFGSLRVQINYVTDSVSNIALVIFRLLFFLKKQCSLISCVCVFFLGKLYAVAQLETYAGIAGSTVTHTHVMSLAPGGSTWIRFGR